MISDGKRLRVLWQQEHGNGDYSSHLIERCISTVKGHPTWKLFCGFVPDPIVRDTNEPPHHVYLDDRACYAIWSSDQYVKQELRTFWPFDFDHVGKIKTGRPNRGRPAYLDDSCTEYAKGTLRDKKKLYLFSGSPDYVNYISPCPGTFKADDNALPALNGPPLLSSATDNTSTSKTSCPVIELGTGRIPFEPMAPRRYIAGPTDGNLLPLGMAHKAVQGSPYFENPTAMYRLRPRPRAGDLAAVMGIVKERKGGEVDEKDTKAGTRKRNMGVEDVGSGKGKKRMRTEESEDTTRA
jgi:hypothetical protein